MMDINPHIFSRTRSKYLNIAAVGLLVVFGSARQVEDHSAPQAQSAGVSTGPPRAAIKDAQSRPITAGGFVGGAPVVFEDITKSSGLNHFHHRSGTREKKTILE